MRFDVVSWAIMNQLNPVEQQFLDFMAERQDRQVAMIKGHYLALKRRFRPQSNRFRHFSEEFIRLHDFYYNIDHPTDYIKLYQQHAGISMLRFLSYADGGSSLLGNAAYFFKLLFGGEGGRALCSLKRELGKKMRNKRALAVEELISKRFDRVVVLDYGCGLAYRSLETALALGGRLERLVLVDIPSLVFDFTCYRVQKAGVEFQRIDISPDHPYPKLPKHQLCFANEVVEHVREPLRLHSRIADAQEKGALLFGDFEDHCPEIYHLHTDLSFFREQLERTHTPLSGDWYERI